MMKNMPNLVPWVPTETKKRYSKQLISQFLLSEYEAVTIEGLIEEDKQSIYVALREYVKRHELPIRVIMHAGEIRLIRGDKF